MQRTLTTLACILLFNVAAFSQDTTWYDNGWKETGSANAAYFRTKIKTDSGWTVTDHYKSGKPQMTGGFADDSFHVKQGVFRFYNEQGVVNHLITYVAGASEGLEVEYYDDGHEAARGGNKNGKREGPWVGFYPSGKLAGKTVYHAGEESSVELFHEDGSRNKKEKVFEKDAQYPGGVDQYLRFLNKTLRYPDSAVVYETQGTVIVSFKVSETGKVSNIAVAQTVDKYLDAEALRVVGLMPDWEPMIIGGVKRESWHKSPIVFKLQAE